MNKSLDFTPKRPLPSIFPLFTWQGKALNHFQAQNQQENQDLSHLSLAQAMTQLYPELSFDEMARFYSRAQTELKLVDQDWKALFKSYGYHFDERLKTAIKTYMLLPESYKAWAAAKDISPKDLLILQSLKGKPLPHQTLETICNLNLTRSQANQILELAVELLLMDHDEAFLLKSSSNYQKWLNQLKELRFPMTTSRDEDQRTQIEQLPWPKKISTRWQRLGDKSGLQLQFHITNKEELSDHIDGLKRILDHWENND